MTKKEEPLLVNIPTRERLEQNPLQPISGSRSSDFTNLIAEQLHGTLWLGHSNRKQQLTRLDAVLAASVGINPKDELEGMLCTQMIAAHNAAMECYRRAMLPEQTFEGRDSSLKHAAKLTRTYAQLLDSLGKYRGKGQQKMTVEHVHVHEGGQAIVGNVENKKQGGGKNKI